MIINSIPHRFNSLPAAKRVIVPSLGRFFFNESNIISPVQTQFANIFAKSNPLKILRVILQNIGGLMLLTHRNIGWLRRTRRRKEELRREGESMHGAVKIDTGVGWMLARVSSRLVCISMNRPVCRFVWTGGRGRGNSCLARGDLRGVGSSLPARNLSD